MLFVLGLITGLLVSAIIFVVLTYFKKSIEETMTIVEKKIELAGPRPKGEIIMPMEESDEIRNEIIETNKKQGKDTPLEDLL